MKKEKQGKYMFVIDPSHPMADKRGRILEHRYLMAAHIGRPLSSDEIVHHINGNGFDNRVENLELMKRGEHTKIHRPSEIILFKCPKCEKEFKRTKRKSKRSKKNFCSRSCSISYYSFTKKRPITHGDTGYGRGCRCEICKKDHADKMKKYRKKKRALAQR